MSWLLLALASLAAAGPVEKADKSLSAFLGGDGEALVAAVERADAAVAKLPEDPAAWAAKGRVLLAVATSPGAVELEGDPAALALQCFENAVRLGVSGAARAALEDAVPSLGSTLTTALTNLVEGKQWPEALAQLDLATRAQAVSAALGQADPERKAALAKLATRVTAQTGDLAAARAHYAALVDATKQDDPGLAALVARKLADAGDVDGALAFLGPVAARLPDDDRLLRTEVELLVGAGRKDEAVTRVDASAERLKASVSGAFLAAGLYDAAGDVVKAREMWSAVVAQDPRHRDARLALGRSLLAMAADLSKDLVAAGAPKMSYRQRKQTEAMVVSALDEAIGHARAVVGAAPTDADARRLQVDALTARLDTTPKPTGKPAAELKIELDAAKGELASLEGAAEEEP